MRQLLTMFRQWREREVQRQRPARQARGRAGDICGYYAPRMRGQPKPRPAPARSALRPAPFLVLLACCVWLSAAQPALAGAAARADPWWRHAVIYEIYPRSFQDSNGDGVGDLNGIAQRLDYLESLGVDAIWIGPFFPSPQVDFGYDISDYQAVDPQFGTLADFERLVAAAGRHTSASSSTWCSTIPRTSIPGFATRRGPATRSTTPSMYGAQAGRAAMAGRCRPTTG